jgi:hypothetical protein
MSGVWLIFYKNTIIFLDSLKPANLHSLKRLELVSRDFWSIYKSSRSVKKIDSIAINTLNFNKY